MYFFQLVSKSGFVEKYVLRGNLRGGPKNALLFNLVRHNVRIDPILELGDPDHVHV